MGRVRPDPFLVGPCVQWVVHGGFSLGKKKKKNPSPWTMHILPLVGRATGLDLMGYPWACISILFYYLFIKKKGPMVNSKLLDYYIYIYN